MEKRVVIEFKQKSEKEWIPCLEAIVNRTIGIRSDSYSIWIPKEFTFPILEPTKPDESPYTADFFQEGKPLEKEKYQYNFFRILCELRLKWLDDTGKQRILVFDNLLVGDKVDNDPLKIWSPAESNYMLTTRIDLYDIRKLWEDQGCVFGEFNVIAKDTKEAFTRINDKFYLTRTLKKTKNNKYERWNLEELTEMCINNLVMNPTLLWKFTSKIQKSDFILGGRLRNAIHPVICHAQRSKKSCEKTA